MKKISYLLIFFMLTGCGYEPIYSKKNSKDILIKNYILEGDKNINKKLVSLLNLKNDNGQKLSSYNLILDSKKNIETAAKDSSGNISIYKTTISINFSLNSLDSGTKIFESKNFDASFSYNSIKNKFDLSQYQKTIEQNLIERLAEEILIYIKS